MKLDHLSKSVKCFETRTKVARSRHLHATDLQERDPRSRLNRARRESFEFLNAGFPTIKTSAISALDFNRHHRQPANAQRPSAGRKARSATSRRWQYCQSYGVSMRISIGLFIIELSVQSCEIHMMSHDAPMYQCWTVCEPAINLIANYPHPDRQRWPMSMKQPTEQVIPTKIQMMTRQHGFPPECRTKG